MSSPRARTLIPTPTSAPPTSCRCRGRARWSRSIAASGVVGGRRRVGASVSASCSQVRRRPASRRTRRSRPRRKRGSSRGHSARSRSPPPTWSRPPPRCASEQRSDVRRGRLDELRAERGPEPPGPAASLPDELRSGRRRPPLGRRSRRSGWLPGGAPRRGDRQQLIRRFQPAGESSLRCRRPRRGRGAAASPVRARSGRISRGGPGRATMRRPSGRVTHQPGAVPFAFGSASADGISQACFRLISGMAMPRLDQRPRSHDSSSGSTTGVSPVTAAIASRVRSSGVGPRPPVETTRSARSRASAKAWLTASRSSGSAWILVTVIPSAVRLRASSPAFVSRVSPTVNSLPMLRSSADNSGRDRTIVAAYRSRNGRDARSRRYHRTNRTCDLCSRAGRSSGSRRSRYGTMARDGSGGGAE